MAGEYFITAELQRRGVQASVTYGIAKKMDVIAFAESNRFRAIEVTSTGERSWVAGGYFRKKAVIKRKLYSVLAPKHDGYRKKYRAKHGKDLSGKSVFTLAYDDANPYL